MSSLHERAKELFLAALSRPAGDRDAFLADACANDAGLRAEVESLLAFHEDDPASAPSSPPPAKDSFAAGDLFAGRYRMIARTGRGGMGDVWRADDLVLDTQVALKLIRSASPEARAHIIKEVRLARQITHPAVCRVFDVGEAGDEVFFSMEFVRGEDLASLLKRVGRLPSEKVIQIAHELCAGLASAHAQGVLHRDLKPANILIDEDGMVRIADFGIAVSANETGRSAMIGTPAYMAPEQLSPGAALSERTDVYALGLVLYELVTGQRAGSRSGTRSDPTRPSLLVPDMNPHLERVILQAIPMDPRDRHASALAMAAGLPDLETGKIGDTWIASATRTRWRTRSWLAMAAAATIVAAAVVGMPLFVSRGAGALTARDTIVLADFLNSTGDPVFDGTLKVALAVALEQSPFLKVFPDERVREDLLLMERKPDERITRVLAREIARREQLKALLAGSIASLGSNYVIALEAVNAETGDVMARDQIEAASKEEVLTSLGTAATRLREKLGESLASIQQYDVSLPRATTPSLEALHAYALALDQGRFSPRLESIPHLKRAIELDPDFALAQAQLSGTYANTGQSALAPEYSRRAFELRDRVSERERFLISWRYYRDATQAWDKALTLAQSWMVAYPREPFAFNSYGFAAWSLGQYEQAIEPLRQGIRLDPRFVALPENLGATLLALNRFEDVRKVLEDARAAQVDFIALRRVAYLVAFVENDAATMARELEVSLAKPEGPQASNWEPRASAFGGRIEKAHEEFRRSVEAASQANLTELAGRHSAQDAESHAIVGQCAEARSEVAMAMRLSRDNFTLESAGRTLAWCGAAADASNVSDELARRFPEAILTTRVILPVIAAATAIKAGQPAHGLELLEPVRPFDRAPASEFWPAYLRGQAHLQLKQSREAAAEFRTIVDHRGEMADSQLYPLAHLGLARAFALAGDTAKARQAYESFFKWWKDADLDLQPIKEAKLEFAVLRS
jgi:serine/threonine protein kinase/predicted Zn-dependent protease